MLKPLARRRFVLVVAVAGVAIVVAAVAALLANDGGGPEEAKAAEVQLLENGEPLGLFAPQEAVARAAQIVDFEIVVPQELPDTSLRLGQVNAWTNPVGGQPTRVYSALVYFRGREFAAKAPVVTIAQFPEPGLLPPDVSDKTTVISVGASKVYVEPGDTRGPALTFGLVVIGSGHPHFNITSQGIPLKDLLDLASALTGN